MVRLLSVALASMLLSGCLGYTPAMRHYSQAEDVKNNAVIIVELVNANEIKIVRLDQNFNNKHRKEYKLRGIRKLRFPLFTESYVSLGGYTQVTFVAEPGVYFISKANYSQGNTNYYTILSGLTPEGRVIYGAFEVKSGEVVYLGDLNFNWYKGAKNLISISSNHNKVVKDLQDSSRYNNLAAKLKPAKFYTKGSTIHMGEDGIIQIDSAN